MRHAAKYLLILFVVAIAAAGGFVFFYIQNITHMEAMCGGPKGEYGAEFTAYEEKFDAVQALAVQQSNAVVCEEIPKWFCRSLRREQCYIQVAVATNDTAICREKMEGRTLTDWCYMEIAVHNKNVSVCDDLKQLYIENPEQPGAHLWPAVQAECYYKVVQITKDMSVCDSLSAEDGKALCHLKLTGGSTQCQQINDSLIRSICESYLREASSNNAE